MPETAPSTPQAATATTPEVAATTPDASPVVVSDLWHTYLRGTPLEAAALRGADFELRDGEIAAIIGHTGSGKSTLVQHLNGLYRPQRGTVRVFGLDLADPAVDPRPIRSKVGLVVQFPEHQLFEPTVGDDVAFGPRKLGCDRPEVRRRVRAAMELVGLSFEGFKDRYTFGLSGGELRRVAITGVLAMEPRVLVLDAPTAGLDPRGRTDLLATLARLRAEHGIAVVFVSHDMEEVAELAERVWLIADGRTALSGTVKEVFRRGDELPVLPFLLIFLVFQILFAGNYDPSGSLVLWTWSAPSPVPIRFTITEASLRLSIVSIGRLICLLILTSILTFTTTTTGLTHGLESLLAPLRPLRVPAHELAMMLAIALRFVPTLADELERIVKAQASRGADFGRPGRLGFIQRARMLVPIVVPLFVGVFRRAEDLILAMEARCYVGGAGRGRLAPLRTTRLDWLALGSIAAYLAAMLLIPWPF